MTVIAWDGKTLAADSRSVTSGMSHAGTKIRRLKDDRGLVGVFGDAGVASQLLHWIENSPGDFAAFPPHLYGNGEGGLVFINPEGEAGQLCGSPMLDMFPAPWAWGGGAEMALGAMHAGATAEEAVQICCEHSEYCGGAVQTIRHETVTPYSRAVDLWLKDHPESTILWNAGSSLGTPIASGKARVWLSKEGREQYTSNGAIGWFDFPTAQEIVMPPMPNFADIVERGWEPPTLTESKFDLAVTYWLRKNPGKTHEWRECVPGTPYPPGVDLEFLQRDGSVNRSILGAVGYRIRANPKPELTTVPALPDPFEYAVWLCKQRGAVRTWIKWHGEALNLATGDDVVWLLKDGSETRIRLHPEVTPPVGYRIVRE